MSDYPPGVPDRSFGCNMVQKLEESSPPREQGNDVVLNGCDRGRSLKGKCCIREVKYELLTWCPPGSFLSVHHSKLLAGFWCCYSAATHLVSSVFRNT